MQATATTLDHEQEYTPINSRNKVLVASLIGTAIEFFDFYIYATAAVIVFPHIFFPQGDPTAATLQSLATFAIAFVARPIGSAVFGHFGDRVGRKATLVASLLTMGISTVVIGLLPGYATAARVSTAVTVAETVIVGAVPETYTYFSTTPDTYEEDLKDYILNNS